MFKKILIANRGEIALRVMWACKELGHQDGGRLLRGRPGQPARPLRGPGGLHRARRGTSTPTSTSPPSSARRRSRGPTPSIPATASSPSPATSPRSARPATSSSSGPGPQAIRLMGDKSRAKKAMMKAGVPVLPGSPGVLEDEEKAVRVAREIGFPVILKASAGGGGRGMRIVRSPGGAGPGLPGRAGGGGGRLRRPRRLHREVRGGPAPHRDPGHGRHARATWCTWASASARSSGATRSCSRRRPRPS